MKNWRHFFAPAILERGMEYLEQNKVGELDPKNSRLIQTTVSGSHNYHVSIKLDSDGIVTDFVCDCPHFESGQNCKHIAAALLKLEKIAPAKLDSTVNEVLNGNEDLVTLRHKISQIRHSYLRHGFVEYYQAQYYCQEMIEFVDHYIDGLIQRKMLKEAFALTKTLLTSFLSTDMDDDGEIVE